MSLKIWVYTGGVIRLSLKKVFFVLLLCFVFPLGITYCTTSVEQQEDVSVLEKDLESIDSELEASISEDEEDEGISEEDEGELAMLDEEFGDDDEDDEDEDESFESEEAEELAMLDEELGEDDDDEEFGEDDEDDEEDEGDLADFDDEDDDEDDDEQGEFADFDDEDDDDEDFDEFDEFDDEDGEVAQNEELENPEGGVKGQSYPEQVMGEGSAEPKKDEPLISDTKESMGFTEDSSLPDDDLGNPDEIVPKDDDERIQTWLPVVKIKMDPFFRNKRLMNSVYIVRPQDRMETISEKIYGNQDQMGNLKADNPHLEKGIDPGDKVYYNSPNRPEDRKQIKVFYEDINLQPQFYKTKKEDNIRKLGFRLLGFHDGWKEIWAINQNVDSKTILPAGLELKYWTGNESTIQASSEELTPPEVETGTEESQLMTGSVDPTEDIPTDPPMDGGVGMTEDLTSTLPPATDADGSAPIAQEEPPPQPEESAASYGGQEVAETGTIEAEGSELEGEAEPEAQPQVSATADKDLFVVGGVILLFLAGIGLVVIQIKKRSSATTVNPGSLEYTQV